ADHLEAVVGRPLEPLELERNVTDRGHQLSLSASGGSLSSEALERWTGAPVSVGGGRWSTALTRRRRSRPSTATAKDTLVRLKTAPITMTTEPARASHAPVPSFASPRPAGG